MVRGERQAGGAPEGSQPGDPASFGRTPLQVDGRVVAFGLLVEAHANLTRLLDDALRNDCGLPLRSLEVLVRIDRWPGRRMTMGELAEAVALTSGGMTRFVDRLEADGLVARVVDRDDRRVIRVQLTDRGVTAMTDALVCHVEHLEVHLGGRLGARDLAAMTRILGRLRGETRTR